MELRCLSKHQHSHPDTHSILLPMKVLVPVSSEYAFDQDDSQSNVALHGLGHGTSSRLVSLTTPFAGISPGPDSFQGQSFGSTSGFNSQSAPLYAIAEDERTLTPANSSEWM